MNSGLTAGDAYPIKATLPSTSATATIEDTSLLSAATTSLRISGINQTTLAGKAIDIIYSTGRDADDTVNYTYSSTYVGFFFSGTDTRVRQEYYLEAATNLAFTGTATAFATTTSATGPSPSTNDHTSVTITMTLDTTATTTGDLVQFVMPYGTTFGAVAFTFASGNDTFNTPSTLSSPTRFYQFPTVWADLSAASTSLTAPVAFTISAINTRLSTYVANTAAGATR
jgi:hypothetical protein